MKQTNTTSKATEANTHACISVIGKNVNILTNEFTFIKESTYNSLLESLKLPKNF